MGLGNLGAKIKAVINKVRGQLDRVLDRVVARIGMLIVKLSPARKTGVPATPTAVADRTADHDQRVAKGLADLPRIESSFAQNGRLPNQQAARLVAQAVKGRHTIFKSVTPRFEQDKVDWVASAGTQPGRLPLAVLTLNVGGIRKEFWNKAGRPGGQVATKVKMAQQYPQHHLQVAGVEGRL